jgi:hypothetical protein
MNPDSIDREEDNRVAEMRRAAKGRPHLTFSNAKRRGGDGYVSFNLPRKITGYSNSAALGDAVRREIIKREWVEAHREDGLVIHVKNGKPLTEHGAKLLGMAWPI